MTRSLRVAVIGLSLSSSWGNGHATTYRALLAALAKRGHDIVFLERDQPWYAEHRDLVRPDFCRLCFYRDRAELNAYRSLIAEADAVIVGSYVAEGVAIGRWAQGLRKGPTAFYDIDTPVTLAKIERGDFEYLSPALIPFYDPYLSFSGGPALEILERRYGSPAARALYCVVDETAYRPLTLPPRFDLGYLGTYSADRQAMLERLLIEPARRAPHLSFVVAGPQFPDGVEWPSNVARYPHVGPADHPAFYASCHFALNVTRGDMVRVGFSPSVRLFEAAACACPIISDRWPGIETLFEPNREILLAETTEDALALLIGMSDAERRAIGEAGRRKLFKAHRARHRAEELERYLLEAESRARLSADRARARIELGGGKAPSIGRAAAIRT